jgi:hypothetical protein
MFQQNGGSYYNSSGNFQQQWVTQDLHSAADSASQLFERHQQIWQEQLEWDVYNSQSSLLGNSGPSSTSFGNYGNGGVGSWGSPFDGPGAGPTTGVPSQPTTNWRDNVNFFGGGGASVQVVYFGLNSSAGRVSDGNFNTCYYVTLCGRVGYGLAAGGGVEFATAYGQPLQNGLDTTFGYFYSGGDGIFGDFSVNWADTLDSLDYSTNVDRLGGGVGGAAGYQMCGTLFFGCTN